MDTIEPKLPQDLERRILEIAFHSEGHQTNRRLLLIARRTRLWLRPLVYHIIRQCFIPTTRGPFPNYIKQRPPSVDLDELCLYVKHLAIDNTRHTTKESGVFIAKCRNVENLACWGANAIDSLSSSISKLPSLRRLSGIFHDFTKNGPSVPRFTTVTHLEISYIVKDWPADILCSFPHLTHLVLNVDQSLSNYPASSLVELLSHCPSLLVFIGSILFRQEIPSDYVELYANNPRMVFTAYGITAVDWLRSARGDDMLWDADIWQQADRIVFARTNRYFKSNDYQKDPISRGFNLFEHLTEEGREWYLSL